MSISRTQLALTCPHGHSPGRVEAVTVEAERRGEMLWVRYMIDAPLDALLIPESAEPARTDLLWHHLCCEAFLRTPGSEPYIEFNFSPSQRWAAYAFDGFREGMTDLPMARDPEIGLDAGETWLALEAEAAIPARFDGDWLIAVSAIVEEVDGHKSLWALRHKPGEPDFHSADGFALLLPEPDA